MEQPCRGLQFYDSEIQNYLEFKTKHKHFKERELAIEEDCAPSGPYRIIWTDSSIGHGFEIECLYCAGKDFLSKDVDW